MRLLEWTKKLNVCGLPPFFSLAFFLQRSLFRTKSSFLFIIFLIPVIPLLLIRNYAYYWDGVDYAWQVENAPFQYLFHPHHLVYTPFMKALFLGFSSFGLNIRSLDFMIVLNILFGIVYLFLCYFLLKRIFINKQYLAPLGTLIIAITYTFGTYWRNVDAYIIPLAITTLILYRIIQPDLRSLKVSLLDWFLLLLAVLFHQISILALPAVAFAQYYTYSKKRIIKTLLVITGFSISLAIIYVFVFYSMSPHLTHKSFFKWVSEYAVRDYWIFNKINGLPQIIFQSFRESVLSHKMLFLASVRPWIFLCEDKIMYGRFSFFNYLSWMIFILITFAIIFGAIKLFSNKYYRLLAVFLFIWTAPFIIIFQIFTPDSSFYRLFYLFPFVIFILTTALHFIRTKLDWMGITLFITGLIVINYTFGFITESFKAINPYLDYAKEVQELTSPRDLFIFSPFPDYSTRIYLSYFTDRDVLMIRLLQSRERASLDDEQLTTLCNESKKWLLSNYDNFYFSRGIVNYSNDFLRISTLDQNKNLPELLVLHKSQIVFTDITEIGTYPFNHAILEDYPLR